MKFDIPSFFARQGNDKAGYGAYQLPLDISLTTGSCIVFVSFQSNVDAN